MWYDYTFTLKAVLLDVIAYPDIDHDLTNISHHNNGWTKAQMLMSAFLNAQRGT